VAFFQAVRAGLAKRASSEQRTEEELDHAVRQIISRAVAPEGVMDLFAASGLEKPDTSSWPKCAACPGATSRWSCSGSC
jgi:type I restriction enzyme R subunit